MANSTNAISAHEATRVPSYSEFKPRLTTKARTAKLTETEQRVIAKIGQGLDLGHVSYPLLYSRNLQVSRPERSALFSLVFNGRVELVVTNCPTTYLLRVVENNLQADNNLLDTGK